MNIKKHKKYIKIEKNESLKSDHPNDKKVGSILVDFKNNKIISYGHNKMLINDKDDVNKSLLYNKISRTHLMCHAEEMCLTNKPNNIKIDDSIWMYITAIPCSTCTRLIMLSGIKNLVYIDNIIGSQWKESCKYSLLLLKSNSINKIELKK